MATKPHAPDSQVPDIPDRFEEAIAQLESIVASMESGQLSLQESMTAYERGVALARACQVQLQQAEQQVKVLEQDLLRPMDAPAASTDSE
ncbi:MAG TPA: exodeoxyribonuclease VII small subunit [Orrella sp.]